MFYSFVLNLSPDPRFSSSPSSSRCSRSSYKSLKLQSSVECFKVFESETNIPKLNVGFDHGFHFGEVGFQAEFVERLDELVDRDVAIVVLVKDVTEAEGVETQGSKPKRGTSGVIAPH
ncbi:hypothetical protein U1Q18_030782 [Sarracenia purpurea var. burkii]